MPVARSATTAFEKPLRVLKALSDPRNTRLSDIATAARLDPASTLRALNALCAEGFVIRDGSAKRYAYGDEAYVLAFALQERRDLRSVARASLARLSAGTGDLVSLLARSGYDSVCIDVEAGDFPRHLSPMAVGIRRPLGVGAGGLALIAWSEPDDFNDVLAHVEPILSRHSRLTRAMLIEESAAARVRGYTKQYRTIVEDVGAIGRPIRGIGGEICGALSISGLLKHVVSRERQIAEMLATEIGLIEKALRQAP